MIPDAEAIVTAYLKDETGFRIVGTTPSDLGKPWVRLTQLDARNESTSRPEHLIAYMLQLECYAGKGGQGEAHQVAALVRETLADMEGEHGDAVVTAVRFAGMPRIPDDAIEPVRERYILTAIASMHRKS